MASRSSEQGSRPREDARREVVDVLAAALIARWFERLDPIAARVTRIGASRRLRRPPTAAPAAGTR
jgi:hypothetical protein